MPLNPQIPLGAQAPQMRSPMSAIAAAGQINERRTLNDSRRLTNEGRQRDLDDDYAINETLREFEGNRDRAIDTLYQRGRANAGALLAKSTYEQRTAQQNAQKEALAAQKTRLELAGGIAGTMVDQTSYASGIPAIVALYPPDQQENVRKLFPAEYNPAHVKQLSEMGMTRAQQLEAQDRAIDNARQATELMMTQARDWTDREKQTLAARDHWNKSAANLLSSTASQDEWDRYQRTLIDQGAPMDVVATYGNQWSPAAVKRAAKLGMDEKDEATIAHQGVTERQANENIGLRRQELQRRKDEDAAGAVPGAPGARPGRALTMNVLEQITARKNKKFDDLEEEIRLLYGKKGGGVGTIPPEAQEEYAKRKLQFENQARAEAQQPPLEEAELMYAADPTKKAELAKIQGVIRKLTGQDSVYTQLRNTADKMKAEKDPVKRAALKAQLRALAQKHPQLAQNPELTGR